MKINDIKDINTDINMYIKSKFTVISLLIMILIIIIFYINILT